MAIIDIVKFFCSLNIVYLTPLRNVDQATHLTFEHAVEPTAKKIPLIKLIVGLSEIFSYVCSSFVDDFINNFFQKFFVDPETIFP